MSFLPQVPVDFGPSGNPKAIYVLIPLFHSARSCVGVFDGELCRMPLKKSMTCQVFQNVFTQNCIDFESWNNDLWEISLSFHDTGSKIMNGPKFDFNSRYSVTRCYTTDYLIISSKTPPDFILILSNKIIWRQTVLLMTNLSSLSRKTGYYLYHVTARLIDMYGFLSAFNVNVYSVPNT